MVDLTASVPTPAGDSTSTRLTSADISERLLRQALEEAETATKRTIELTTQLVETIAENAELRAQLERLQHGRRYAPTEIREDDA